MQQRLPSLLDPPLAFAHRGARAHAPENTIEAFELALKLGATGLESDVWVTADGVPVLDHDGVLQRGIRRRKVSELRRVELPEHIPTLADLIDAVGPQVPLSLDVYDPDAYGPIAEVVRAVGHDLPSRTWLCDHDIERLVSMRDELADFRLVHSTRLSKLTGGPERHASRLQRDRIDAVNMHRTDWNGGLVVLFHRFDRFAFGWDQQFDHQLEAAVRMGLDAIYSDHVDTMTDVMTREVG